MDFLRRNRLEVRMIVSPRAACFSISFLDLIFASLLFANHCVEYSSRYNYLAWGSLCYMIIGGVNFLLGLLLLFGVQQNNIRNCRLYIFLWVPSFLCLVALYIFSIVTYPPLYNYQKLFGGLSAPFYIQLVAYPILLLVYKPLNIFLVRRLILDLIRAQRRRQDSTKRRTDNNGVSNNNPNNNKRANNGTPNNAPSPHPPDYRSMGRRPNNRDPLEMHELVPGIHDLFNDMEFPMENQVSSDQFKTEEGMMTMEHDFFVKKGTLSLMEGSFGGHTKRVPVAVKIFRQNVNVEAVRRMLLETKILTMFSKHNNVIKLLAFCTENIHKGKMTLLMEFCEKGRLGDFLKENYTTFQDLIVNDIYTSEPIQEESEETDKSLENIYQNVMNSQTLLSSGSSSDFKFNSRTLLNWALQISNGMEFIEEKGIIHGNLMAQNCIIDDRNRIRISNFTFATQLYHFKQTQIPIDFSLIQNIPWRWYAIECMNTDPPDPSFFTSKSDVWSVGVVLWEIFSLGCQPYEGLSSSQFFPKLSKEGYRLEKPSFASSKVYKIIKECWHQDPGHRPTFTQLKNSIVEIIQQSFMK